MCCSVLKLNIAALTNVLKGLVKEKNHYHLYLKIILIELSEQAIDYTEAHLPKLMATATKQTYWQSLQLGNSVLIAKNGKLLRVRDEK